MRKSVCTICDPMTQCGLDCYVKDGRIIKVEGSLENPHSAGTLCAKGAAQRQWVYHEDRLRTPAQAGGPPGLRRVRPHLLERGARHRRREPAAAQGESGPESVVFYCGYPKQLRPFLQRLALLYGSPNYCTESSACFTAIIMGWRLDLRADGRPRSGQHQVCCSCGPATPSTAAPPNARQLMDARDRGVKFIVVDPRSLPYAAIADLHLKLRPGTDGALALAMANVIISEGLYDRQFVSEWTRGFEESAPTRPPSRSSGPRR